MLFENSRVLAPVRDDSYHFKCSGISPRDTCICGVPAQYIYVCICMGHTLNSIYRHTILVMYVRMYWDKCSWTRLLVLGSAKFVFTFKTTS